MPKPNHVCVVCQKPFHNYNTTAKACSLHCNGVLGYRTVVEKHGGPEKYLEYRFWSKVDRSNPEGCWEWKGRLNEFGYGQFYHEGTCKHAHRISYLLTYKELPDNLFVCHKCDNPPCVNPAHLWLGTPKGNTQDSINKGRNTLVKNRGTGGRAVVNGNIPESRLYSSYTNFAKKLNPSKVRTIRYLYSTKQYTYKDIAKIYEVTPSAIAGVIRQKTWRHLKD
jgi:hypothetical protein